MIVRSSQYNFMENFGYHVIMTQLNLEVEVNCHGQEIVGCDTDPKKILVCGVDPFSTGSYFVHMDL